MIRGVIQQGGQISKMARLWSRECLEKSRHPGKRETLGEIWDARITEWDGVPQQGRGGGGGDRNDRAGGENIGGPFTTKPKENMWKRSLSRESFKLGVLRV